jgi:hypothetical protein
MKNMRKEKGGGAEKLGFCRSQLQNARNLYGIPFASLFKESFTIRRLVCTSDQCKNYVWSKEERKMSREITGTMRSVSSSMMTPIGTPGVREKKE